MGEGGSVDEYRVGRRRGLVLGVFCSLLRGRLGFGCAFGPARSVSARVACSRGSVAIGGAGIDGDLVQDPGMEVGCAEDKGEEETYECLSSFCCWFCRLISDFKSSSWWTAMLKRFQKFGSRVAMVCCA